jgi:Replication initiator protein A
MHDTEANAQTTTDAQRSDKLYIESNLLRIAGVLFCHDQKVAGKRTAQIELNAGVTEKHIIIRPDQKLGQPGPLAHKIFVALVKKHSDYGRPVRSEIHFTRREIGRLIGRKEWGGRDSEQLSRALHEIHYTFVTTHFKQPGGRFVEHSFVIFPEILIERREFPSDPIEACTITLAEPIVRSLQDEHFTCLNHGLMQHLGTIGQAIYMRCFFHFANLYTGANRSRLAFPKRYDDICSEWLGGLALCAHRSVIERDQLGPHLKQLVGSGFLSSYDISKAKGRDGFVITFKPGHAFFDDYERFYRRRAQGELQWAFQADQRKIGAPLKLAYLFAEKRTGRPVASVAYVNSKDVETAKQFLTEITFEESPAFIEFALASAKKTGFDVQTLGGLRQYLAPFKAQQAAQALVHHTNATDRRHEDQRLAYDSYRRKEAFAIFETLLADQQQEIEALARKAAAGFDGSLADAMFRTKRYQITAQRYGDRIKTFDEWTAGA